MLHFYHGFIWNQYLIGVSLNSKGARGPTSCTGPRCWVSCVLSISNFTREVSSPWKRLRLTLKQAHIQQLRLLKVGKVFFYLQHVIFHGFLLMCLVIFKDDIKDPPYLYKIHTLKADESYSQVDRKRFSSTSASWSRAHSSRAREPGAIHVKMSYCTCCLKRKYGINTHIPTDRTVVGTPPCFNLLQSLRNCHHKAGRI